MSMHYWKVILTCYTPICIGSGETYKKSQYIYVKEERKVYLLREEKWISFLWKHGIIDDFANELLQNPARFNLYAYLVHQPTLTKKYRNFSGIKRVLQLEGAIQEGDHYLSSGGMDGNKGPNDIVGFIRDVEGNPYIPGSSLKGSFRTAILSYEISKNQKLYARDWENIKSVAGDTKKMGSAMDRLEKKLSIEPDDEGKMDMVRSYFRGLVVSDAVLKKGNLCIVPKEDLTIHEGETHRVALFREALAIDSELEFTIGIDDSSKGMGHFGIRRFDDLLKVLKEFVHFQYQILYSPFKDSQLAEEALQDIKKAKNADLLLGSGTGFLSKTLTYSLAPIPQDAVYVTRKLMEREFRNGKHFRDKEISPHTLKMVEVDEYDYLMGLCYLEGQLLC